MRAFIFCLLLAYAAADPLFGQPQEEEFQDGTGEVYDARIFTSNNLGLNQTIDGRAFLAAGLVGLLFAVVLGYSFFGDEATGYNYQKQGYAHEQQQGYANSNQFYQRSDAHFNDMASQMHQLFESFKKWEVQDQDCQQYVVCEAAQRERHEENGELAVLVFDVMQKLKKRGKEQVGFKNPYVANLLDLFQWAESQEGVLKDACQKQRATCYQATKKQQ